MPASHPDPKPADEEQRRSKRHVLEAEPPVTAIAGGKIYHCRIEDISFGGLKLRFEGAVPPGNAIALDHRSAGMLHGMCIWRDATTVGVELQLPRRALERLLRCLCLVL